jgi:TolA-binding protein
VKSGRAEKALAVIEAFEARPDVAGHRAEAAFYAGEALRALGRHEEARSRYEACVAAEGPFRADAYLGLGLSRKSTGDPAAARAAFEGALEEAGDDHALAIRARMELADLLSGEGHPAEAAKAYLAVGILYDDPAAVPEALRRAAAAYEQAGLPEEAREVRKELEARFGAAGGGAS